MSSTIDLMDTGEIANPTRRMLLAGMLSGYAASLIPWALAQPIADANKGEVRFCDQVGKGFTLLTLTPEHATADSVTLSGSTAHGSAVPRRPE